MKAKQVALLASSNLDLLKTPLVAGLAEKGMDASIWAAGFNQYRQAILEPASELYTRDIDEVILFLDAADVFSEVLNNPLTATAEVRGAAVEQALNDLKQLVESIAARLPKASIYLNTVALDGMNLLYGLEYNSGISLRRLIAAYNEGLVAIAQDNPSVVVVDVESIANSIGMDRWFDRRLWYLGRIRYGREAFAVLAREYANVIAARGGRTRKCIVLDLDNTLWGGIIGEDGLTGIQMGQEGVGLAFTEFQEELLNLNRRGIMLALCSKNNPDDALQAIREHGGMVLKEEHFSATRVNWVEKSENIREIANELNIGLDSLVFIDDNPVERTQVRLAVPEVCVPEWPRDPSDYRHALLEVMRSELLRFELTEEDRNRAEMYRAQSQRRAVAGSTGDLESFYRSLEMKMTLGQADGKSTPRIAQLTQKTNQFNLTTRRYSEQDIVRLSSSRSSRVYWMELTDRFGPNGIIGVIIARRQDPNVWMLDTFLMSCRVIGRTVENAFFNAVAEELREAGATSLIGEYVPTAKNSMVAELYPKLGFMPEATTDGGSTLWRLDLGEASLALPEWFEMKMLVASEV